MECKNPSCGKTVDRHEAKETGGYCPKCAEDRAEKDKIRRDLMTSFAGKGRRGFVQWLMKGKFLQGIEEDKDVHLHNDRVEVIDAMIKGRFDKLTEKVASAVLAIAGEENADEV